MILFEKHGIKENDLFKWTTLNVEHFPSHFHRAFELIIVRRGKAQILLDNENPVIVENDLAFIFPNEIHEIKVIGKSAIEIILFSPEMVGDFYVQYKGMSPENHILKLSKLPEKESLNSLFEQKGYLYMLCGNLIRNTLFKSMEGNDKNRVIYQILSYIDTNFQKECSLMMMAKYLKYDYYYLSKYFVNRMNMTFTEYLNQYRILHSCYLIKNSDKQIGEIATECGYNNLKTFHRNFHKILGESPSLYKKKC